MRVLAVGDLMVVVSGRVERMPRPGENVVLGGASVHASGVAANIALNLRSLDVDVTVLSAVGRDPTGDAVLRELDDAGVDTSLVIRRGDAPTAAMAVMVGPDGERTMVGTRGASQHFRFRDARELLEAMRPDWLHFSGYTSLQDAMARRCHALSLEGHRRGIPCSIDLEGAAHRRRLMRADVWFSNLAKRRRPFRRPPVRAYPGVTWVVKDGRRGCYLAESGVVTHIQATPVELVDSTGAGDAFDAAFIAARLRGHDLETACRWGNEAGARTVAVHGPRADLAARPGPWS